MRRDTLKRNSGIYRHISRICVNEDYKSHFDSSHLAIVELESPFTDMNPFYSPLWSVNGRWAEWDVAHPDF